MKKILIIGAGLSTKSLIRYLIESAAEENWHITVCDRDLALAESKVGAAECATAKALDIQDEDARGAFIREADIVISMLPAALHIVVARDCLRYEKNLVTASYISDELNQLDDNVKEKGLIFLNEMGVDPGIDHMSAMRVIDALRVQQNAEIFRFESFTGGLVAPECDDNPWHYKFTWNPRNVVLAGQGDPIQFLQNGRLKFIPYHQMFTRSERIEIDGYGMFEGYANRDSLRYIDTYNLRGIATMYRGTLRRPGFCRAWDVFVKLGVTEDSFIIEDSETMTYRSFINSFLSYNPTDSVELKLMHYLKIDHDSDIMDKLQWLGIFENEKIGLVRATPAQVLQRLLEKKWALGEDELDMIAMVHHFSYKVGDVVKHLQSSMVVKGLKATETAMSKTVGLPVAIAAKMILNGTIHVAGVQLPVKPEIYLPVLDELAKSGIIFRERFVSHLP